MLFLFSENSQKVVYRVSHKLIGFRLLGFFIETDVTFNNFMVRYCYENVFKRKQVNMFQTLYVMQAREDYITGSLSKYPRVPPKKYGYVATIWNVRVNFNV
jgi:hypothetical protein